MDTVSCLSSSRIFPSLPGSHLIIFYRDASSALLQLVNKSLNFTYLARVLTLFATKATIKILVFTRIKLTTSAFVDVRDYLLDHSGDEEADDYGSEKLNIDICQVLAEYGNLVDNEEICQHIQLVSLRHINNISVQCNGGLLPDIILLTQGY